MNNEIFICLTHVDTGIAEALRELIGDTTKVYFSTSTELAV